MTKHQAQELLNKYTDGTCTPEEKALIDRWYLLESSGQRLANEDEDLSAVKTEMWMAIREMSGIEGQRRRTGRIIKAISIAASIIIIISTGLYFYKLRKVQEIVQAGKPAPIQKDIDPGGNKAVLTLADGSKIVLDDSGQGFIASQAGINIRKSPDGSIVYDMQGAENQKAASEIYNTIETPKGGKYQLILPDGSKVWMNAASSLRFPAVFKGKERHVELTGEAYFEVAKNKKLPFTVQTKDQTIYVTGTQFNVMAYNDESYSATTLIEGTVQVSNTSQKLIMEPGEQVVNKGGTPLIKREVAVEEAIAWKNGLFQFNNTDIQTVMRQISRWYDVSVEYQGAVPSNHFGGYISRDSKLSQVLKMLELSGVRFSIEENKIIVLP